MRLCGILRSNVVLIETYWNVNYASTVALDIDAIVLIETYWNVNADVQLFMKRLRKY